MILDHLGYITVSQRNVDVAHHVRDKQLCSNPPGMSPTYEPFSLMLRR